MAGGVRPGVRRPPEPSEWLRSLNFAELRNNLQRYSGEFGQREATTAFLVSQPTWGEDPRLALGAIKGLVNRSAGAADLESPGRAAENDLIQGRRVRILRLGPRIAAAAAAARSGIAFREDSHFHAIRLLPIVRGALLETGERLARAGVLAQPGDVWHLRFDEISAHRRPGPGGGRAARPAARRGRGSSRAARGVRRGAADLPGLTASATH